YNQILNYELEQIKIGSTKEGINTFIYKLMKNSHLNKNQIIDIYKFNFEALIRKIEQLRNTKIFHIEEALGLALERTRNKIYNRHLPFDNMFFEYNMNFKDFNIIGFHITKDKFGVTITIHYLKENNNVLSQHIGFFDRFDEENPIESGVLKDMTKLTAKLNKIDLMKKKDKRHIRNFFCNFLDFLNCPDVDIVVIERTEKENRKRVLIGKNPIPSQTFIRVKGKLKIYLNELKSAGYFNYSHRFWVRGHFRTLRSPKWKNKQGTKIWIPPYIKGKGRLIERVYEVEKPKGEEHT
ncbi:hypothetical protein LCGC14_1220010, partial [marine sediment metagenome]